MPRDDATVLLDACLMLVIMCEGFSYFICKVR